MGDNRPYPKCHEWNERVMAKLIADHPDYVFTTSTRPWNIKPGDVMPAHLHRHLADVVGQQHSDSRHARHAVAGAQRRAVLPGRLPGQTAATRSPAESSDPTYCRTTTRHWISSRSSRCCKPLDMSDAVCRKDYLPRRGGKCVAVSRLSPHLDDVHAHHDQRTRTPDRRSHRLVGWLMSSAEPASVPTVWPGTATPSAPPTTARAPTSRCSPRCAERVELCLIAKDGTRGADQPRRGRRLRLALLPAHRHARSALRLPGARAVGPAGRAPLRPEQAAARSVRQVLPRRLRVQPGAVLLRPGSRRPRLGRHAAEDRLARPHHDQRGDQPVLPVGIRPRTPHAVPRDGHLRGPRQGHDADPPGHPRGAARHLRRARASGDHRPPQVAQRDRDRADAGAPVPARPPAARPGTAKLLGLQHFRLLRAALPVRRQPSTPAARSPSSRPWSGRSTRPASRSSSTWSTTTPPRATTSAPRSTSAASTTPPTTGCSTATCGYYKDFTGTGNSLNARHPHTLQLIMDSLRYWVLEMHVDGFRFDLAADAGPRVLRRRPAVARSSIWCSRTRWSARSS